MTESHPARLEPSRRDLIRNTGAAAAVGAIEAIAKGTLEVTPLQAYFDKSF